MNISNNTYNIGSCSIGKAMQVALFVELLDKMYHRVHDEADNKLHSGSVYGVNSVNITFNINNLHNTYSAGGKYDIGTEQVGNNINTKV